MVNDVAAMHCDRLESWKSRNALGADSRRFDALSAVMTLPVSVGEPQEASTNAQGHHCKRGEPVCLRKIDGDGCRCSFFGVAYPTNGRSHGGPSHSKKRFLAQMRRSGGREIAGCPNVPSFQFFFRWERLSIKKVKGGPPMVQPRSTLWSGVNPLPERGGPPGPAIIAISR